MSHRITTLFLAAGLFACSGGGSTAPVDQVVDPGVFTYATSQDVTFDLSFVDENGAPVSGVSVQIMSSVAPPSPEEEGEAFTSGELFFLGASDASGRFHGAASIPTVHETLDVVAHKAGWSGSYTFEELEFMWGPFAPSARIQLERARTLAHVITLEEN